MGIKEVPSPEYSHIAADLLGAYHMISRSRRYEQGIPLSISIADIESYIDMYDCPIELHIFVEAIFMLDDLFIEKACEKK
ncbi:hypothetical protein [Acinetobacter larvae]|uniref:HD-GYP domain-containing protein n=1 Tax=Acinetobacter larvae TaxID=1789224 RepID=A0A1B2LZ73_9GAMM|nr:hypothetical protein [Acinetobacter larvae]AOA58221.1 hypothetical protein BFG52_07560 [Acinetobacter larvae]